MAGSARTVIDGRSTFVLKFAIASESTFGGLGGIHAYQRRRLGITGPGNRSRIVWGDAMTKQPSPTPGWYPDPSGIAGQMYWNGHEWGSPPPKPPTDKRRLLIAGGGAGAVLLAIALGSMGSGSDSATPTAATVTKTMTVTASPTTVTETVPPAISTVTVTEAAPPVPFFEPPASESQPLPPAPEALPSIVPLVPQIPSSVHYGSCAAARAAGAAPLYVGEPGYRSGLDRDGDGVACE